MPDNGVFSCVPFGMRSLGRFERCGWIILVASLPVVDEVASCVVGLHSPGNLLGPLVRPAASHKLHPLPRRRPPEEPRASTDGRGLGHQPTPSISESTERAAGRSFQVLKL